jgi:uncharacterized protein YqcC (DUF446 family)
LIDDFCNAQYSSATLNMHDAVIEKLNQIEAEMRRIGYWQDDPPDLQALVERGELRSYLDAPSFELWLQVIFLPNARRAAEANTLPADSQVGLMALRQYDYHSVLPEAHGLMRRLFEFDEIVRSRGH